ncbi:MAG: hypothetical protein JO351_03055 [Candidatus Eremiobacteraeota bacterium]|nr:hypothetical protein [Candidatus Eremiobacteraeota bacterium]
MNLRRLSIPCISLTGIALTGLSACASHAASTLGSLDAVLPSVPAGAPAKRQLLLYAGGPNQNVVGVYPARSYNPPPQLEIRSGLNVPTGIAVDASGNVYVCNNAGTDAPVEPMGKGTWTVSVYHRGQTTPFESYTTGVWNPVDVAVASDGTVYIANYSSAVTVYPAGSLQPSMSLAGPSGESPLGVALDGSRNVYVSYVNPSRGGSIYKYAPGQSSGSDLGIAFSGSPHGLAIDRGGNLLVAVSTAPSPGSSIEVFPPGKTHPKKTITGVFQPFMLAFGRGGRQLFAADFGSGNGDGGVFRFAYPAGTLLGKDTQGPASSAYGIALDVTSK